MRYHRYSKNCDFTSHYTIQFTCTGTYNIFQISWSPGSICKSTDGQDTLVSLPSKNIHIMTITITQIKICIQKCVFLPWHLALIYPNIRVRSFSGVLEKASTDSWELVLCIPSQCHICEFMLVAWNWPWWEYLCLRNWWKLQIIQPLSLPFSIKILNLWRFFNIS